MAKTLELASLLVGACEWSSSTGAALGLNPTFNFVNLKGLVNIT